MKIIVYAQSSWYIKFREKAGARCQGIEKSEVRINQPRIAACEGCGGQRDAGPDCAG